VVLFIHAVDLPSGFRLIVRRGFPTSVRFGWWLAAWLAVVVTQSVLAVHSDLVAHADDEQCELCAAAASSGAALPTSQPPALLVVPAAAVLATAPGHIVLARHHLPLQPRAPPASLS
jgi:hypothetical protein